ncbi:MAG: exodeoxyribonuclease III [Desulfobacterales bacterium]|jgi:exodeoxyribonuclease-3|nr:exodeoxyribonuclease III [Desulfobacterales bacterium]
MNVKRIKLVSWNVNGLRAAWEKGFLKSFIKLDADVVCVQETKLQEAQLSENMKAIEGYESFWSFCDIKKGYSGVGAWSRISPRSVGYGIGMDAYDREGRILEFDFGDFILFNVYFPNGQMGEDRLRYKMDFYKAFFEYADSLRDSGRSLVICGDFNTAHNEIDLKNPKANEKTSGFLRIERDWLDTITADGYVDTFRHLYPDTVKYSWWTYRFKARERNVGWRIDYFFVTSDLISKGRVKEAFIENEYLGSDHCPVGLALTF